MVCRHREAGSHVSEGAAASRYAAIRNHANLIIVFGNSLSSDGHATARFDYCIVNPPVGVGWSKVVGRTAQHLERHRWTGGEQLGIQSRDPACPHPVLRLPIPRRGVERNVRGVGLVHYRDSRCACAARDSAKS